MHDKHAYTYEYMQLYVYVGMCLGIFFNEKQDTQANLGLKFFIKVLKQESVWSLF